MSKYHHYNKKLKPNARKHRNKSTKAEIRMWSQILRARKMMGYEFLRQRPIDWFIADFFCKELKLVIEVDGYTHSWPETIERDKRKTRVLKELGYRVLRFTDEEVLYHTESVRRLLELWIERNG